MRALVLACALALSVTACGGDEPEQAAPTPEAAAVVTDAPDPTPTEEAQVDGEGSVTVEDFVAYPDGLTVRLARVERVPAEWGSGVGDGEALLRVTLALENDAGAAVPLEPQARKLGLMYGPNRQDARSEAGFFTDDPEQALQSDDPQQVGAGETVEVFGSFVVPEDGLDALAVEVNVDRETYTPFVFTDVETLL